MTDVETPYSPSDPVQTTIDVSTSNVEVSINGNGVASPEKGQNITLELSTPEKSLENGVDGNGDATKVNGEVEQEPEAPVMNGEMETEKHETKETQKVETVEAPRVVQNETPKEETKVSAPPANTDITELKANDTPAPADRYRVWSRDDSVRLQMESSGPLSQAPLTVYTAFSNTVKKYPDTVALASKRNGEWVKWTYKQYYDEVVAAAKSYIKLGVERCHGVGIIGFNAPEWFISYLGSIYAGAFGVGIYTTNNPEACAYVLESCEANVCVVENNVQLQKVLKVWNQLPHLKAIVQYHGEVAEKKENVYSWSEFMALGRDISLSAVQERISLQTPNKCCTLIYTSGTTGNPKGVMLSHDNYTWMGTQIASVGRMQVGNEVLVSYLPLSHVAAQLMDLYVPLMYGISVYFAQPDALKGSLKTTLNEVRPTVFFGVPRVWEKMQEALQALGKNTRGLKKKIGAWAKGIGLKGNQSLMNGGSTPFGWTIANALVFKKVRHGLGLDRCRICLTGAAPIMKDTVDYMMSLNLPLCEVYGMSESTGPHTAAVPWQYRVPSVGKETTGCITVIQNEDSEGNGEICMKGRHVMMGYLNEEQKTKDALDEDGLLHSGDQGRKDKDGFLYITGRLKELIITAGGENVAPVPIEDAVKEQLPGISNCMLIGDKRKFLSMLLTMKVEVDENTSPTDNLSGPALDWCKSVGSQATKVSDILDGKDAAVLKAIQEGIDRANKKATSRAQNIGKWSLLAKDFSIPGGELGPTLKLKRPVVHKMYAKTIDAFYGE